MEENCTRCGVPFAPESPRVAMALYVPGGPGRRGEYHLGCAAESLRKWREAEPSTPEKARP